MKLAASISAGALIVVYAAFVLFYALASNAHAAVPCHGIVGEASFYGVESCVKPPPNCRTANGEKYTGRALSAASRTLPFNTRVRVTYRGKSVVVRISDRGPAAWTGRAIDLSRAAAEKIGLIRAGVGLVCLEQLG